MDFTIKIYEELLGSLIKSSYCFQTFEDFITKPKERSVVLRHDVDRLPSNSLRFAILQSKLGLKGTYYFRAVPGSWDIEIIKKISSLGHEIGYHYENLTICKGDIDLALEDFQTNLEKLRLICPVATICMHGSPMSKFDSKDIWSKYCYSDFGIVGEPYFDVDYNKVLYLTDTGRMWDGEKYSVRDKVSSSFNSSYHKTNEIISDINRNKLGNQIIFNFHPQRWHNNFLSWGNELILQKSKNVVKKYFYV